jgi:hypothetical protein
MIYAWHVKGRDPLTFKVTSWQVWGFLKLGGVPFLLGTARIK